MDKWLSGANVVDLSSSRGNGPFRTFLGVILHVNVDENGTPLSFWRSNPGQVTPNFQVFKNGHVDQLLPFNWQPWCQINGNFNYAAIETAGLPSEPLTVAQIDSIARILRVYHNEMGMSYALANSPGQRGLGTHKMGGGAWGGHECPGTIRTAQRAHILSVAKGNAQPGPGVHLRHAWTLPKGHYYGPITGPDESHGGFYANERPTIELIQRRLVHLGFLPGKYNPGHYDPVTLHAVSLFQEKHHLKPTIPGCVGRGTWEELFTY